ncbi:ABC-type Na+ efflux pump permease subunit [Breznakia sp. PF5-3]|uniref:ABC transporter permease n=1 Tax=unclassified Breznakia TaxID=2623764 RepID=UPI002404D41A|nr:MULTISPECIES: ABC transporter permease [unclassified Breznakia]MDF9824137.1 ABC-type Na+ efflux pump permease subunit [Breznakia sp. PM6-1]MDF9834935.1 ABC-type Na+ efflux pump permease subunit [Breznakia sp. PF5-3]MDF9837196.1 ABC-type Na+ efflux pump permease subunit [Breznakia sp. PFB2-8]MDF9859186.1 ABC-type Na+ efflux pump permease subunit [Breznakia sp. PH5-24]
MKQFLTIFKFEFLGLVKTKTYIVTTTIFVLIAVIGLSIPSFFGEIETSDAKDTLVEQLTSKVDYIVYDPDGVLDDEGETLKMYFPNAKFKTADSLDALKKSVSDEKADGGFYVKENYSFTYYVYDSSMTDVTNTIFSEAISQVKRNHAFDEAGLDANKVMDIYYKNTSIGKTEILGSDGANNFFYTIVMILIIYMITVMYGNVIATTVASEKGNRTMELLVTSASTNALIFGKVLATALAAFIQVGMFVGSTFLAYSLNASAWNGMLDAMFNIPTSVLVAFAVFGIFGFLFYAFIFGALGALVSKSEDVNSSATPITVVFVAIYLVVYLGVMDPTNTIFKIASFIPLSSPMAMFARMAMVDVPIFEVLISFGILIVSTVLVGMGASKIYRRGTLMYGNQIKLLHALKWLKRTKE